MAAGIEGNEEERFLEGNDKEPNERFRRLVVGHQFAHDAALLTQRLRDHVIGELQKAYYRVAVVGGHLVRPSSPSYGAAFEMARLLAENHIDALYGGGPGVMEAVPRALEETGGNALAISISMGFVDQVNTGLHHLEFASASFGERLDWFYGLAADCVCLDGGFGTALEGTYFLQISQKALAAHLLHRKAKKPGLPAREFLYSANPWIAAGYIPKVIYVGPTWEPQRRQIDEFLRLGTIRPEDAELAVFVDTPEDACRLLNERREKEWRPMVKTLGRTPRN